MNWVASQSGTPSPSRKARTVHWRRPVGVIPRTHNAPTTNPRPGPPISTGSPERRLPELRRLQAPRHPTHRAIADLAPSDQLRVRPKSDRWELRNHEGAVVGSLARSFEAPTNMRCAGAAVLAVVPWSRERSHPRYQERLNKDPWEIAIPELVIDPASSEQQ